MVSHLCGRVGRAENHLKSGIVGFRDGALRISDPSTIRTDKMGILDGLWRREYCIRPQRKDADLLAKLGVVEGVVGEKTGTRT